MQLEDYAPGNIESYSFGEMMKEVASLLAKGQELEREAYHNYMDGYVASAMEDAAEIGRINLKIQIIEREATRRDEEEGPMDIVDAGAVREAIFETLKAKLAEGLE